MAVLAAGLGVFHPANWCHLRPTEAMQVKAFGHYIIPRFRLKLSCFSGL
jgi:hypothetical protein